MAKRKAAELENFQEHSKKQGKTSESEIVAGNSLIAEFLARLQAIDPLSLATEMPSLICSLKDKMEQNAFISELIKES